MTFLMGPHMLHCSPKPKVRAHDYSLGFAPFQLLLQPQEGFLGMRQGIVPDLTRKTLLLTPAAEENQQQSANVLHLFPAP